MERGLRIQNFKKFREGYAYIAPTIARGLPIYLEIILTKNHSGYNLMSSACRLAKDPYCPLVTF